MSVYEMHVGSWRPGLSYRELADQLHYAGYIFVAIIVLFIGLVFLSKKVIERAERKHLTADDEPTARQGIQDDVKD
jgi:flagellar biosynthesis/type III secretory pathway M-ring protein FliF/YscJ